MSRSSRSRWSEVYDFEEDVPAEVLPPAERFPNLNLPVRPADGEPTEIDIGGGVKIVWKKPNIPGDYPTLPYVVAPPFPHLEIPPSPPPLSHFPPEWGLMEPSERPLLPLPSPVPGLRIICGTGWNDQHSSPSAFYQTPMETPSENDPTNTTIFVGGLDPNVTEQALGRVFSQFGEVSHVEKRFGFGFVHFTRRSSAEEALLALNGSRLGRQNIKLSWGRQPPEVHRQRNQQYDSYRYDHPLHHLSASDVAAYGAYPGYRKYPC